MHDSCHNLLEVCQRVQKYDRSRMECLDQEVPVDLDSQDQDVQTEDHHRGYDNLRNPCERLKGDRGVCGILCNLIQVVPEKDV